MITEPQKLQIYIAESPSAVAADAVETFVRLSQRASPSAPFRVALSGGSTPKLLYGLLASETFKNEVPWRDIQFFFGDERWVPPTSRDSNYKLAKDELLSKVDVDTTYVFPIPTEGISPDDSATQYEGTLRRQFRAGEGEVPHFDLIFLGMGDDGHTASIFPHTAPINETKRLVVAHYVDKLATDRVTLTPPVLWKAAEVIFLVSGDAKAPALKEVLEGEYNPEEYPSQLLRKAKGTVTWLLDRAAAAQLEGRYAET